VFISTSTIISYVHKDSAVNFVLDSEHSTKCGCLRIRMVLRCVNQVSKGMHPKVCRTLTGRNVDLLAGTLRLRNRHHKSLTVFYSLLPSA
jgi:hypothetical protein